MRVARTVLAVAAAALLMALTGCPSLDGFATDGGGDEAEAEAGGPSGGYLSLDDAARYCSKVITCANLGKSAQISLDIPMDSANFSSCVSWMAGTVPPDRVGVAQAQRALDCALQATSCSDANACMWFEFIGPADPRCVGYTGGNLGACSPTHASTYQCNFGFIAHCDDPFNYTGSSCLEGNTGFYFCAVSSGLCATDGGALPPSSCSGSFYEYCNEGFLVGYDCNVQGMTCGQDPGTKQYACLTNGHNAPCNTAGNVSCSGDTVDVCDGLLTSEFDCAALGGTCDASGAVARCALPADSCSPFDPDRNVCTGDSIALCVAGQPLDFDCTSIGMHCVDGTAKLSAHCE